MCTEARHEETPAANSTSPHQPCDLLVLAYLYPPAREVGAQRPARLLKYLRKHGHRVTVVSATERRGVEIEGTVHRLRGDMYDRYPPTLMEKVFRKSLQTLGWGAAWACNAGPYAARLAGPGTVLLSTAPPFAVHAAAAWVKRRCGAPWVADFRDPVPAFASAVRNTIARRFEAYVLSSADAVLANTDAVAERWRAVYPQWASKITVLPNGFDPDDPVAALPIPSRGYRVLLHAGSIYSSRNPILVLRAFEALWKAGDPVAADVKIRFLGRLHARAEAHQMIERLAESGHVELLPESSVPEARRAIGESDFLLLLDLLEGDTAGTQIGAKLYEYVQVGRPILLSAIRHSASERVLQSTGLPYVALHPEDGPDELTAKARTFLAYSSTANPLPASFLSEYSAPQQALHLHRIIETLARAEGAEP